MKFYWSSNSVPELQDLPPADRRRVWLSAWRRSGGLSLSELALLVLAAMLGANFGPLGAGLCGGIVYIPIFSRKVEKIRPTLLSARRELGLGAPSSPA